jgi:hypothetical protein
MTLLVRFQDLTAESMKFRFVFWDVLPCKIIVDRRFRGTCCLHYQGDDPDDGGSTYLKYLSADFSEVRAASIIRAMTLMMEAART